MAEAAVEERPHHKFYCHMCNVQFETVSANYTCPHCSDGFIEELSEAPAAANADEGGDVRDDDDDDEDDEMDIHDLFLASSGMDTRRTSARTRHQPDGRTGRRTLTRLASSNLRQNVPFENLIQDFILNLGVGLNWGTSGNMQLFLGNPGDYAWGREGLDAIVTQLLNQMDSTGNYGPPPVSKDVIDALPTIKVGQEQTGAKLQCSVCWEDFVLDETVRQLPCTHIYHELCIRPWLELHGTCPICRQNLINNDEQSSSDSNQDSGGSASSSSSSGGSDAMQQIRNILQQQTNNSSNNSRSTSIENESRSTPSPSTRSSSSNNDSMM